VRQRSALDSRHLRPDLGTDWLGRLVADAVHAVGDRRAPLRHLINIGRYVVFAFVVCQFLLATARGRPVSTSGPSSTSNALLWEVVIIDTCLLGYRALQKCISVLGIYNLKQAFFSIRARSSTCHRLLGDDEGDAHVSGRQVP